MLQGDRVVVFRGATTRQYPIDADPAKVHASVERLAQRAPEDAVAGVGRVAVSGFYRHVHDRPYGAPGGQVRGRWCLTTTTSTAESGSTRLLRAVAWLPPLWFVARWRGGACERGRGSRCASSSARRCARDARRRSPRSLRYRSVPAGRARRLADHFDIPTRPQRVDQVGHVRLRNSHRESPFS